MCPVHWRSGSGLSAALWRWRQIHRRGGERQVYAWSEPQPYGGLHAAHRIGVLRKTELKVAKHRVPCAENGMVQQVRGFDARVEIKVLAGAKGALHASIKAELIW